MSRLPTVPPIVHSRLLLGEGRDEVEIFRRLLADHGATDFQVLAYNGRYNLRDFLKALAVSSDMRNVRRIVVSRDADESSASALQSIEDAIAVARFPDSIRVKGLAVSGPSESGALEDLFWTAVPNGNQRTCVERLFECVGHNEPSAKALMHAWLALQVRPNLRVGEAVSAGLLTLQHPVFDELGKKILQHLS